MATLRPAAHAGAIYPAEAAPLRELLEGYFAAPGGPGAPDGVRRSRKLVGLVAPHIDFPRGGSTYAWAYREVLESGLADLYVILGVAHESPPRPFAATRRDYDTPFGPAATDRRLLGALARRAPYDLFADEAVHLDEHSVEFQAVFLRYAGERLKGKFHVLPLLCSYRGRHKEAVLRSLAELLRGYKGRVCLVAGVDLAHVGPRFGDPFPVSPSLLEWVEAEDRKSLARVLELDAEGFHRSVMADGDKRRVCGLDALYAFTWLLRELEPGAKGTLLRYGHAPDPAGGEVSFASLAFRR